MNEYKCYYCNGKVTDQGMHYQCHVCSRAFWFDEVDETNDCVPVVHEGVIYHKDEFIRRIYNPVIRDLLYMTRVKEVMALLKSNFNDEYCSDEENRLAFSRFLRCQRNMDDITIGDKLWTWTK